MRGLLVGWAVLSLLVVGLVGWSSPLFSRSAPPSGASPPSAALSFDGRLSADHPMFYDLGIMDRCGLSVVGDGGWWPDALGPPADPGTGPGE